MTDKFQNFQDGLESPPSHVYDVTPDDTADLPSVTRCLNVATSGTVRVTARGGETVTLTVSAGVVFPIRARRIWASGTTATGIVALY